MIDRKLEECMPKVKEYAAATKEEWRHEAWIRENVKREGLAFFDNENVVLPEYTLRLSLDEL